MMSSYATTVKKFQHTGRMTARRTAPMALMKMTKGAHSLVITAKKFQQTGRMTARRTVLMDLMRMMAQWKAQNNLKD